VVIVTGEGNVEKEKDKGRTSLGFSAGGKGERGKVSDTTNFFYIWTRKRKGSIEKGATWPSSKGEERGGEGEDFVPAGEKKVIRLLHVLGGGEWRTFFTAREEGWRGGQCFVIRAEKKKVLAGKKPTQVFPEGRKSGGERIEAGFVSLGEEKGSQR